MFLMKLSLFLIYFLNKIAQILKYTFFPGFLKWSIGLYIPVISRWGLDSLLETSGMSEYFERELKYKCVVHKRVRVLSRSSRRFGKKKTKTYKKHLHRNILDRGVILGNVAIVLKKKTYKGTGLHKNSQVTKDCDHERTSLFVVG